MICLRWEIAYVFGDYKDLEDDWRYDAENYEARNDRDNSLQIWLSLSRKANTGENICHIDKISLPKRDARIQIGLNKQKVAGSMADVTWSGEAVCDIIQSQSLF